MPGPFTSEPAGCDAGRPEGLGFGGLGFRDELLGSVVQFGLHSGFVRFGLGDF